MQPENAEVRTARQRVAMNMWREKKLQVKCGATRGSIKVAAEKRSMRVKNEVAEGNVGAGVKITWCGVHAKIDTWVIHHP